MISPCQISGEQLSHYRDRELPPAELATLAAHVDGCESCQARLADSIALNLLLVEQAQRWEAELPAGFAASVMAKLPAAPEKRSRFAAARLRELWGALWGAISFERPAVTWGLLGAAAVAALAIVFAPQLRSHDDRLEEATENEAQIHSIEVSSPDRDAVVFDSAEGNTIIWMVTAGEDDAGPAAPAAGTP